MKDLNYCIEFVENSVLDLTRPGRTKFECYAALMQAQQPLIMPMPLTLLKTITLHGFSKKDLDFWTCVVRLMAKYIAREIKVMLQAKLARHYVVMLRAETAKEKNYRDGIIDSSLWAKIITPPPDFDPDYFRGKVEASRDPPLVFIPIPKLVESNGCARSDLNPFAYLFVAAGLNLVSTC